VKSTLALLVLFVLSPLANAGFLPYFKDEDGHTKWQYVANFSSGVLILLLLGVVTILVFSRRRLSVTNHDLNEIRSDLEYRVKERTATLDESNRLLTESNRLLLGEIAEHKETSGLLRYSEGYIKDILESMPVMLVGVNEAMVVTQWNNYAEKITGVSARQALNKNLWDAYPTITVSQDQVSRVLSERKPITIKHSQRGQYYFDITIYPLCDQVDTGLVILIDDVSSRIMAENMLVQRDKMSSMGELASTMAYDINRPLEAILEDLQFVRDTVALVDSGDALSTSAIKELPSRLDDALARGREATSVISNLLAFAGAQSEAKQPGYLPDIVDHAIELAEDVLSDPGGLKFRDIQIERAYADGISVIPCYASELQQVFLSLFRHACHSLGQVQREGFVPTIRIEILECYEALWIKVEHNGLGLSSDEQQYLFEPFFNNPSEKDDDTTKRLSFSSFIVTEQHQGQLAVTSDPEVGTTFHMQLALK
jgi:PAS domain S-box-containing protein